MKKATDNDGHDWGLLIHLARPAFIATRDFTFIDLLRDVPSYQVPWVRTFGELLTDPLPLGNPWGESAKRQAAAFTRRPRAELDALDKDVRARLKAAAGGAT